MRERKEQESNVRKRDTQKRRLEELNLLDDFLFETILAHPGWGEPFGRLLLETIFQRRLGALKIVPQRTYYGKDTDLHGAVMDVYFEELPETAESGRVSLYDVEPDRRKKDLRQLSRRARFYHALIDSDSLKSGEEYASLKNVMVLFITPYDPFGGGRMMYTIRSMCAEDPRLFYDDGAQTVFLYTKGTNGNPSKELRELLHYMEYSVEENAVNEDLRRLHQIVEAAKQNREVRLDYMKSWEREREIREEAREEAYKEAYEEAYEEASAKERLKTERERERAEWEKTRADQEKARADQAEEELARLREELRRYKDKGQHGD